MAHAMYEMTRIKNLMIDLGLKCHTPMVMHYDNQPTISITNNLIFHERTKHIKVNCHFIRNVLLTKKKIFIPFVKSKDQIADIFTKRLHSQRLSTLYGKAGMVNILRGSIKK